MAIFGRAEFVVNGPDLTVASAQLVTLKVDAGPDGDRSTAYIYIYIYTEREREREREREKGGESE